MTREATLEIVRSQILAVLPAIPKERISLDATFRELGADSVDRSDIYTGALDALGLELPLVKLAEAQSVGALVDLLYESYTHFRQSTRPA